MYDGLLPIILQICRVHLNRAMLTIHSFIFGPFQENTYVIHDPTGSGVIIDPGCYEQSEQRQLHDYIVDNNIKITSIVNTHCHIDHVLGNEYAKKEFDAPLYIPQGEESVFKSVKVYAPNYGFPNYHEAEVDGYLFEDNSLNIGESVWDILLVPGHSPDIWPSISLRINIVLGVTSCLMVVLVVQTCQEETSKH